MTTNHRHHPPEQSVKDTADLIFLYMTDEGVQDRAEVFNGRLRDEVPTITAEGVANMWKWVRR